MLDAAIGQLVPNRAKHARKVFATALLQLERLASAGDPRAQFEVRCPI